MRNPSMAAIALLAFWVDSARADTTKTETVGHFLVSQPARNLDEVINYCAENVPELKSDFLEARAGFIERLREAEMPLLERVKIDPELSAPVQDKLRQKMAESQSHAMSIFGQQDPRIVCHNSLEHIKSATVDEIRKVVEDNFQYLRGVAQE